MQSKKGRTQPRPNFYQNTSHYAVLPLCCSFESDSQLIWMNTMTDTAVTTIQAWQTSDSDENGGRFRYNFNLYEFSKLQITTLTSQIMVKIQKNQA